MQRHEVVSEDMTHRAVCVRPEEDLYHAYAIMQRCRFHHLPVVEHGELIGILDDRDILKCTYIRDGILSAGIRTVRDAMHTGPATCRPSDRIGDAADQMLHSNVDALVVLDDNQKVIGILTTKDLLIALRRMEGVLDIGAVLEQKL